MPRITIRKEHLRKPENSDEIMIGYESPGPCEGAVCGLANLIMLEDFGKLHFHGQIVVYSEKPKTAPRYFAFNFEDPEIHGPYHQERIFFKPLS